MFLYQGHTRVNFFHERQEVKSLTAKLPFNSASQLENFGPERCEWRKLVAPTTNLVFVFQSKQNLASFCEIDVKYTAVRSGKKGMGSTACLVAVTQATWVC